MEDESSGLLAPPNTARNFSRILKSYFSFGSKGGVTEVESPNFSYFDGEKIVYNVERKTFFRFIKHNRIKGYE